MTRRLALGGLGLLLLGIGCGEDGGPTNVIDPIDWSTIGDSVLWFTGFERGRQRPEVGEGHWDPLRTSGLAVASDIVLSGDSSGTVNYLPQRESTFLWAADSVGRHNPVFVQWSLYVPPDYIHEPLNGRNDAANWKWLLIGTCNGYEPTCAAIDSRSSWTVWMESDPCDGDCLTRTHLKYGVAGSRIFEQAIMDYRIGEASEPLVATADLGTWVTYTFEVRHATNNATLDGELRLWKNGACIYELTGFPLGGDPSVGTAHAAGAMLYGWDNSASHNEMRYDNIGVYAVKPDNLQWCS